jgi:uncharacterized protein
MRELITALLLVLAVEGLLLAAFPEGMRKAMAETASLPPRVLRIAGFVLALLGVFGVWAARGFPAVKLM